MMVAATDGSISIANFETYFSIQRLPALLVAETLRHIQGSTATDRWQFPVIRSLRLQLDLEEDDLVGGLVEHVVLDAGLAEIGFSEPEPRLGTLATGRHDGHLACGHRHDHVIHFMDVAAGGAARRQPPLS